MAESEEELKSLLMRVKEERLKSWPKAQHSKTKIMASGPITSQHIQGKKVEALIDFLFLDSKITEVVTAAMKLKDACSLEGEL